MPPETRTRILDVTADLFRRYGYNGTGLKQIVAEANAPFGSLYHFFPDGKEQLGDAAIRQSGRMYLELFATIMGAAPDVVTGVADFFAGAAETLRETDYADACPIATVALEVASRSETLRIATADVFESWIAAGTARFAQESIAPDDARRLTIGIIALLEGAFVLSRATRSTEAVDIAGAQAVGLVRGALDAARRP